MSDSAGDTSLRIHLATDRKAYAPGDTIRATLTITHHGTRSVALEFGTSQRCDFEIHDAAGRTVWRWAADRMFAQMIGEETLGPERRAMLCREHFTAPGTPGRYQLVGKLVSGNQPMQATVAVTLRGKARPVAPN